LQKKHYISPIAKRVKQQQDGTTGNEDVLLEKIARLEKQLAHQGAESRVTGYLNQCARKQLNISIRKKPITPQFRK